jgi:hypothetical protein
LSGIGLGAILAVALGSGTLHDALPAAPPAEPLTLQQRPWLFAPLAAMVSVIMAPAFLTPLFGRDAAGLMLRAVFGGSVAALAVSAVLCLMHDLPLATALEAGLRGGAGVMGGIAVGGLTGAVAGAILGAAAAAAMPLAQGLEPPRPRSIGDPDGPGAEEKTVGFIVAFERLANASGGALAPLALGIVVLASAGATLGAAFGPWLTFAPPG